MMSAVCPVLAGDRRQTVGPLILRSLLRSTSNGRYFLPLPGTVETAVCGLYSPSAVFAIFDLFSYAIIQVSLVNLHI